MRPILSTLLCACLVSPSAAQVHSAAAAFRGPGTGAPIALIGGLSAPVSPAWNAGLSIKPSALTTAQPVAPIAPLAPATVAATVKLKKTKRAAAGVRSKPVSDAALRVKEESFWSGSKDKPAGDDPVVVAGAPEAAPSLARRAAPLLAVPVAAAGLVLAPSINSMPAWTSALIPAAQGAGVLAGAYALSRAARWAIDKFVPRFGGDAHDVVTAHYAANVVIWTASAGLALTLVGVPTAVLYATFGAGGLAFFTTIKDVVGNLFNAGRFLIARPFTIGDRVTIGKVTGVVTDLGLRYMTLNDEAGGITTILYSKLATEVVTLYGPYDIGTHGLGLRLSVMQGGVFHALRETALPTLVKPLLYAALAGAALFAMPLLQAYLVGSSISWLAAALPYFKAGVIALLTGALSRPLRAAIERVGFDPSTATVVKALVSTVVWLIGGSFALNALGFTWAALATNMAVSTLIIGVALMDSINAVVHGGLFLKEKRAKIGQSVRLGDHAGVIVDITSQHVILKTVDGQYKMVPNSIAKDLINTPESNQSRN